MNLDVRLERFELAEPFTISRGAKTEAVVVVVTLSDGQHVGRGEAVPYARYGETPDAVVRAIEAGGPLEGAAANAMDLAQIDLDAKMRGVRAWEHLGLVRPTPRPILFTIPLRDPDETRAAAARESSWPTLKLKLGRDDDLERVRAAREGSPDARFIVDANEGWDLAQLNRLAPDLAVLGVELIEQPLPAAEDGALRGYTGTIPLCADESFRGDAALLEDLADRYQAVNVKLDKAGGLRPALRCVQRARELGLKIMVGSMVASSLAVAPAVLLAQGTEWADLDAPLYLRYDRDPGLRFGGADVHPPTQELWG